MEDDPLDAARHVKRLEAEARVRQRRLYAYRASTEFLGAKLDQARNIIIKFIDLGEYEEVEEFLASIPDRD